MKKSLTIVGVIILTVILAVFSILTALRLKELGTRPVAPTVPESKPKAVDVGPPDDLTPAAVCKKSLSVGETAPPISCAAKVAYRNKSSNSAGNYTLEDKIEGNETVETNEKVVFSINAEPVGTGKSITVTDVLPSSLIFLDSEDGCRYTASNRTVSCSASEVRHFVFRVKVADNATGKITNTATVREQGGEASNCSVELNVAEKETPSPPPESYCDYLDADKTNGQAPLTVEFEGKGFDPSAVKGFRFKFGDGEKKEIFGSFTSDHKETVSHTYSRAGSYKAVLEILDNNNEWKTRSECEVTVTVTAPEITAPPTEELEPTAPPTRTQAQRVTATPTEKAEPTPTEVTLPVAGLKIPTLGGILTGFLLISLGVALVF